MTDGQPNQGEAVNGSHEEALIQYCEQMKKKGYYIYTLGFFAELYGEDKRIPQQMFPGHGKSGMSL